MYSFCVEEQKGLTYHLEGLGVPLVVRVPQFGNHWYRRCNNGFAFLRFLEFCVVAGNKSNCNLINFYCKLQLHNNKKSPLQLLENM